MNNSNKDYVIYCTRLTGGGGLIDCFAAFDSLALNLLKNLFDTKN